MRFLTIGLAVLFVLCFSPMAQGEGDHQLTSHTSLTSGKDRADHVQPHNDCVVEEDENPCKWGFYGQAISNGGGRCDTTVTRKKVKKGICPCWLKIDFTATVGDAVMWGSGSDSGVGGTVSLSVNLPLINCNGRVNYKVSVSCFDPPPLEPGEDNTEEGLGPEINETLLRIKGKCSVECDDDDMADAIDG